jgi:transcription elongation factor Elf1
MKPCPFCGEEKDLGVEGGIDKHKGLFVYISCGTCGARGPWKYFTGTCFPSVEFVADYSGWNNRKGDA